MPKQHPDERVLAEMLGKLTGVQDSIAMQQASYKDQLREEIEAEQAHVRELEKRHGDGESAETLRDELDHAYDRLGELTEAYHGAHDRADRNKRWFGHSRGEW